MKKKSQPSFCKSLRSKLLPLLLSAFLVCSLCESPAFAMDGGEAGITPDPPTNIVNPTPEPQPDPEPPAESSSTPSSSNSSESSSSSGGNSSPNNSSSGNESQGNSQASSSGSDWNSENSSSSSSRPSWNGNTSSSKTSYADPDPNESYVEYIPPKNNGNDNNGHTTSAQNPVAIAPNDDTEILSSQNWQELLSVDSNASSKETASSSLASIGGIFGKNNNTGGGGTSIVLILGIVMLVLGAGGVGFFIYSQFIYKRRKGADSAEDYENSHLDYGEPDDGYGGYDERPYPPNYRAKGDTAPLQFEKTDRDISSFSDPTMKPTNPIQPPPAEPSRRVEDIDWDQFFKDNRKK